MNHIKVPVNYKKVFSTSYSENGLSFCVTKKSGRSFDFPYSHYLKAELTADFGKIKITHTEAKIIITGENLKKIFDSIRNRDLNVLFEGAEAGENESMMRISCIDVEKNDG